MQDPETVCHAGKRQKDRKADSQTKRERRPTKYKRTDRQRGREHQKIQTDRQKKNHVDLCLVTLTKGAKKLIALNFEKLASFFLPLTFAAMDL